MRYLLVLLVFLVAVPGTSLSQERLVVERATKEVVIKGYTRGKTNVTVSSEVSGKLLRVNYDVGQKIGGEPFFEIDTTFVDFQIKAARRNIEQLGIVLEKSRSKTAYLEKEYKRIEKLHLENTAAEAKKDLAAEEFAQARLEQESVIKQIAMVDTRIRELQERRRRHRIHAPEGWVVVKKIVEAGEVVRPDMPLAEVADYRNLIVPLAVSSDELDTIKKLPKEFAAYIDGKPVKAEINWINPEFNETTRKLNIELILRRYDGDKRGGLLFSMPVDIQSEGLKIPKSAVVNRYENPKVRLKGSGEEIRVLVLGETNDHLVIAEDDRLAPGTELEKD